MYRASQSLAAENIIKSDLGIDYLVMSMCRVVSCVVGRGCLLWPVYSTDKTLWALALLHFVLQGQYCLLFRVSLDFLILHSNPLWWKGHLFWVLVAEGHIGLHWTSQPQLLWLGQRLGLLWCWMVCLRNEPDYSVLFDTALKYCISDFFVDHFFKEILAHSSRYNVKWKLLRCLTLCDPMHYKQTMEISRPEYWSKGEKPFPSPGDLPNPGIESRSGTSQVDSLTAEPPAYDILVDIISIWIKFTHSWSVQFTDS